MGSAEKPMVAGCSAQGAEGAGRNGDVQSPESKVQSQVAGEAEFAFLRSKTSFRVEGHPEGWTPNGKGNVQGPSSKVQKANIEHPTSNTEHRVEDEGALKLRPYQKDVFWDQTSGILVLHWSRQIGKSFVLAAWAVLRLMKRPGRLVTVLSNSKENGAEFLMKCAEVCRLHGTRFETVVKTPGLDFEDMRMELRIRNKGKVGRIKVLAANPRTARGFSGDLILDEFAFHEDGNKIWEAAEPILASNKDFLCRIASTGNGKRNLFYRMTGEGNSLTTDGHGLTRMGKRTDEKDFLTADKAGCTRMGSEKSGNIEHRTSNTEHRMENGESRTSTRTTTRTNCELRIGEAVAGMIVDGVAYVPGAACQGQEGPMSKVQGPKLGNIELPALNAEHRMENGKSRTSTRTTTS